MNLAAITDMQKEVCRKHGVPFTPCEPGQKVGISLNVRQGMFPVNGLRQRPYDSTCGWYFYAGEEMSLDEDFFKPLHWEHVNEWQPMIVKYLGLPPGWRFLIATDYEDVWFDHALLEKE